MLGMKAQGYCRRNADNLTVYPDTGAFTSHTTPLGS